MSFILDTDVCVQSLRGDRQLTAKIEAEPVGTVGITSLTACELAYGAYKSNRVNANLALLESLFAQVRVYHTTSGVEDWYGSIRVQTERQGLKLDDVDLLIAAIVLHEGATLVTRNIKHFRRIEPLHLVEW